MLSKAETSVVNFVKTGMSNKDIADVLCISEKTVKFHLTNIFVKEGVKSRFELAAKYRGDYVCKEEIINELRPNPYLPRSVKVENIPSGARPVSPERIVPVHEARQMQQGARQVQVVQKSQEDKITFIDEKFKVGETITQLHSMMKDVVSKELTPNTVNAACNCVARLNETINTAIQAAKFLNER